MAGMIDKWLTEDALLLITGWARDGLTLADIAHNMGVCLRTLVNWKEKNDKIRKALEDGKEPADRRVENELYKRALGYTVVLRRPYKVKEAEYDPETGKRVREYERIVYADYEEHYPGDVTAQIYWLKNRKPKQWRDKQETIVTADIEDLTPLVELLK